MYITFKNNSTSEKKIVSVGNKKYIINPNESVDVFCGSDKTEFVAETAAFDELTNAVDELDGEAESYRFKDKILAKLTKKMAEKLPEIALNISVKYEITCNDFQDTVVNLYDGVYSVCDGMIADFFDMMPVGFLFARAETDGGNIRVVDASATNRKQFMKLMKKLLLFMHWGFIFVDLFLFVPEYLVLKFYSSHFYIQKFFIGFYNRSADERTEILAKKEQKYEKEDKKGCLSGLLKGLAVLLVLGGLCWWGMTSEPDVIISEDFQSVVCFDEVFVRIDGGLPDDAEEVFLEDYTAYYPLADGEYDMDNYYCYIYEDSAGARYMWVKDDCSKEENADKDYEDYANPLVYKSTGEAD